MRIYAYMETPVNISNFKCRINVYHDTINGVYTLYLSSHKGGPIISDADLDVAKTKFDEAMKLILAVDDLLFFNDAVMSNDAQKKIMAKKIFVKKNYQPEFVNV